MGTTTSTLSMSYVNQEDTHIRPGLNTVPLRLAYYAKECPDKEAVVFASNDRDRQSVTYAELFKKSLQIAQAFIHIGIKPKEYVAISLQTCPEWLYVAFGATIAGARPFGVRFTYKDGSDIISMMDKLQCCTCMVMDPGFEYENWNIMSKLIDNISSDGRVTSDNMPSMRFLFAHNQGNVMSGVKTIQELLHDKIEPVQFPEICEDDVAILLQTSGSTGCAKFVAHSHYGIATFYDFNADTHHVYSGEDIYFNERPFESAGGFPFELSIGQTRVTCSSFCKPPKDKDQFLVDTILKEKCNVISALPSTLYRIKRRKNEFAENWHFKSILTDGQPITKRVFSGFESFAKYFVVVYGSTELPVIAINVMEDLTQMVDYDCGPPLPGFEVKVVDEAGYIVPVGIRGEIYVRSKKMFIGYVNDEKKTNAVLSSDGWYKTDDVGLMLENGSLHVEGRKSNLIISGGMNVNLEILEKVISTCPGVEGVVLVPVPDDKLHQIICACVKIASGSDVDTNVIRKFCEDAHGDKQRLFTVLPNYYLIIDSFPVTRTGKVSRQALAEIAIKRLNNC